MNEIIYMYEFQEDIPTRKDIEYEEELKQLEEDYLYYDTAWKSYCDSYFQTTFTNDKDL